LQPLLPLVLHFLGQNSAEGTWGPGLALLWVALDRLDEARAEFEKAAANDFSELPRDGRWTTCIAYMTEVCAALDDTARAEVLYHLLLPYAGRALLLGGGVVFAGAAERYLGLLCTTMRRWQDAESHFDEAVYLNARLGAHLPLAHTQCDYAAMLLTRGSAGDQKRATALLHSSNDTARRLGLKAVGDRVETMMLRLHPKTALPAPADELTPREREVLGLMAIGRSNSDIALALSISLNTVTTHVRNILAKTGCANRTEAAAYALRRGTPQ
jgi:DNA-binding NarL/FixJ family response regulator